MGQKSHMEDVAPTDPWSIRTPDQRVRVFVSSTLDELAPERVAAREAIAQLRLIPVLFESGARPYPPRELYRAYLTQSDVFIGLYWQRYGWVAPTMKLSGLEDEYQLSAGKPRLIYIKLPAAAREPGLQQLLDRIRADGVTSYHKFTTPQELHELIANDLALLLTERFTQAPRLADAVQPAPLPAARGGQLIGREREVEQVRELLLREDVGLVTLTGPGGVGKTRVAVQVAAELAPQFADGVAFVSLAALNTPDLVNQTVAQALQVSESPGQSIGERLLDYVRDKHLLLVLDNVEQVISAAPLATQGLEHAPRLKLLVTSREPLRLRTEQVVSIEPLALPDPNHLSDLATIAQVPSVALFLERARAVNPDFALADDNVATIVEICRRLDGLPLALELAAARLSLLGSAALLARMNHRLLLLTQGARDLPQRQQTLRSTLAWSYDLLEEREQHMFRHLAVFVGSFSLDAAESVSADEKNDENDGMELVAALLAKSLLQPTDAVGAEPYFRMLETVREYALEQLAASGEEMTAKRRHADFYLRLAETADPHLLRAERNVWQERLDQAYDNLRAALRWSSENGAIEIALRLAAALGWFWSLRGTIHEGRTFLEALLAQSQQMDSSAARAKALWAVSILAWAQGDIDVASQQAEASIAVFRAIGDRYWLGRALVSLGSIQVSQGQIEAARSSLEESRRLFQEQDPPLMFVLYQLGRAAFASGDMTEATTLYQQVLAIARREGDLLGEATVLGAMGVVAAAQGDAVTAQSLMAQSLPLMRATGDRRDLRQFLLAAGNIRLKQADLKQAHNLFTESLRLGDTSEHQEDSAGIRLSLIGLAAVAAAQEHVERAGRLLGAAEMLSSHPVNFFSEAGRIDMDQDMAQACTHLDKAVFDAAWVAGQAMTKAQAISYALQAD